MYVPIKTMFVDIEILEYLQEMAVNTRLENWQDVGIADQ